MIGLKAFAKRHWPRLRLRTILLTTLLLVAALPGFGAVFLRVYENTLVRQTEAELIAQGAALSAAAAATWPGAPVAAMPVVLAPRDYRPEPPGIDLNDTPVLAERPSPQPAAGAVDAAAAATASRLAPVVTATARTTLAAILLLDSQGRIASARASGGSYRAIPEVRTALAGHPATVLRRNGAYRPRYALEWLSRASDIRIHHARPIIVGGQVVGVLLLSRSPRALFRGIYQDRGKIAIGVAAILAALVVLSGLLSRGIARPIAALGAATRAVAAGHGTVPDPPSTAAIEIQALYADFQRMAAAIDMRSRYLRDFAHAVSHEFKTPLAGIRGAIELLQDHHPAMREAERQQFLANAAADADRLARLVTRLLDLARADMAQPDRDVATDLADPLACIADGLRSPVLAIELALPGDLPAVAVPAATIEAVLIGLIENSRQAGAGRVTIAAVATADHVELVLADDGPGIPPADRARIFEPFFTSRRTTGGTGLGLAIARSLLAASLATIALTEAPTGAAFRILMPRR